MGGEDQEELKRQVAALTARVYQLERAIQQTMFTHPLAGPAAETPTERPASRVTEELPSIGPALVDDPFTSAGTTGQSSSEQRERIPPAPRDTLESRIGSQFFNRIGIFALLIGTAWFLKLAIDNQWIGPLGRVLVGLVAGSALVLWSERFRARGYLAFAYSLKAVASGILYLSIWAAYSLFHLVPAGVAFVAMLLVTAWNGFMAWVQDAELLALYAIVGGFSTPLLLSTGENHELMLFGYILVLDTAVLTLVSARPWSRLLLGAFAGTLFFSAGWYFRFYSDSQFALTAGFAAAFVVLFAIAPRLMFPAPVQESATRVPALLVLLPLADAALGFIAFYALLDHPLRRWAQPWAAVAFAGFYLLLLKFPSRRLRTGEQTLLSALHLALAVVFLSIAIPLEAHGRWITIGWLVEGAALMWAARRLRLPLLRGLAAASLVLGFCSLLFTNAGWSISTPPVRGAASETVIFNWRFATYLAAAAAFAIVIWIAGQAARGLDSLTPPADSPTQQAERLSWASIAAAALVAMNFLLLVAGAQEIHTYWWAGQTYRIYGPAFNARTMNAQFTYSAWAMLFGAVLLTIGFWRRSAYLRWQALVLVAVTIAKVFLYDIGRLSQGYRVLSFLGLGALLLAVSFVYQRDLLHLKNEKQEDEVPGNKGELHAEGQQEHPQ